MFKRIFLLIIYVFLALPVFADDCSIIPVLWLFNNLNFNTLYELRDSTESSSFTNNRLRTFEKSGNKVFELKDSTESSSFTNNRLRTFEIH